MQSGAQWADRAVGANGANGGIGSTGWLGGKGALGPPGTRRPPEDSGMTGLTGPKTSPNRTEGIPSAPVMAG